MIVVVVVGVVVVIIVVVMVTAILAIGLAIMIMAIPLSSSPKSYLTTALGMCTISAEHRAEQLTLPFMEVRFSVSFKPRRMNEL